MVAVNGWFLGVVGENTSVCFSGCHRFKIQSMIYTGIFVVGNFNVPKSSPLTSEYLSYVSGKFRIFLNPARDHSALQGWQHTADLIYHSDSLSVFSVFQYTTICPLEVHFRCTLLHSKGRLPLTHISIK